MLEKQIVAAIQRYLKTLGKDCFVWKVWGGGQYSHAGIPDICGVYKGRFIALEVKTPTGRLTELQRVTIEKINTAGGYAAKVTTLDEVKAIIRRIDADVAHDGADTTHDGANSAHDSAPCNIRPP